MFETELAGINVSFFQKKLDMSEIWPEWLSLCLFKCEYKVAAERFSVEFDLVLD